jgi:AbrB family looped-hinge helix DNA binding protein
MAIISIKFYLWYKNMMPLGIVRHIDRSGRLVIPVEGREHLGLSEKDSVQLFLVEDGLLIK